MAEERQSSGGSGSDGLTAGEEEKLVYALESRFAPHLEAAASTVREAERELEAARERLEQARTAAEDQGYTPDLLVFMRESVKEEVEALGRKTNAKKIRSSYRFLLDRAVELGAGEVQRFRDDQAAAQREREHGLEACEAAVERAADALHEARATQDRVTAAERSARLGLRLMVEKLTAPPGA